jgi:hypothetical protein
MRRLLTAALVLALAPAASAADSDSLLSGYGGPGDGEQALLGATLIGESGGSAPASSGTPAAAAPAPDAIYAPAEPAPATAPATLTPTAPQKRPSRRPRHSRIPIGTSTPEIVHTTTAPTAPTAPAQAAPASAPAPLDSRDLALVLAALIALGVLAACARRLAVRAARTRRPLTLQAP